jgi:hypothetical protein
MRSTKRMIKDINRTVESIRTDMETVLVDESEASKAALLARALLDRYAENTNVFDVGYHLPRAAADDETICRLAIELYNRDKPEHLQLVFGL